MPGEFGAAPADCVMVGDSVADIAAARAVVVPAIAYANKPHKRGRLQTQSPAAIVAHLAGLTTAV
ncbi:HAD hydrolase-like protein [Haloechinothrix halophila]|uniref:HAD hydrolase-like protein n=1 Tax=Haloechinothrix halophila TaxID=1069073 RepID=UPI0009FC16D5|nr:HAD hydrolase-like protein [Haloechinothrix halophila]